MTDPSSTLLTSAQVEDMLAVDRGWAARDRITAGRIPHLKIGRYCRYRLADVQAFIESSKRRSTSDTQQPA